jgi:hypothetical protein
MHNANLSSLKTIWIDGCIQWMMNWVSVGWSAYYLNIMFNPLPGSLPTIVSTMHRGIHKGFYCSLCTRFVRNPRSPSEQQRLPKLWLYPDRPGFRRKRKKYSSDLLTRNDNGLHFNGALLLPPKSRFHGSIIEHISENQTRYCRHGIERIHVKEADYIPGAIDYAGKTVKWGRADPDDILILPLSPGELPNKTPSWSPSGRAVKDMQSALNVSDEIAEAIYAKELAG